MNPNNYCTLEAAKRLVEAGIVIDTDFYHVKHLSGGYWQQSIRSKNELLNIPIENVAEVLPAPSMAEVWRELPDSVQLFKDPIIKQTVARLFNSSTFAGTNTTDALIELLIWVRREAKS
jgi:hypothetical protein